MEPRFIMRATRSGNKLSFDMLTSLVKMEISDGKLEELPSRFGQQHEKLVVVDLSYQRITLIPESITDIPYLRNLDFRNNSLSSLSTRNGKSHRI